MHSACPAMILACALMQGEGQVPQAELNPLQLEKAARLDYLKKRGAEYEIHLESDPPEKLTLLEPVLRFNDNVTGVIDAVLFLWTDKGRPEVAASFWFRRSSQTEHHEFQSLSTKKLVAKRGGQPAWHPSEPGIEMKPIAKDSPPATTALQRLFQMRSLAREFSASVTDPTGRQQLRLLPQPVYRYGGSERELLDGALFLFVKGTNPEAMLLLEASAVGSGHQWQYALARMTVRQIEVHRGGELIWKTAHLRWPHWKNPDGTYVEIAERH